MTPAQREALITQRTKLQQNVADLQAKWKRKKFLEKEVPKAYKKKWFQGVRSNVNTVNTTQKAIREPIKTIANGVKDKLGIKTEQDKREEKNPFSKTGKDVPQSEIIEDFAKAREEWEKLKTELDGMPSDQDMLDRMRQLNRMISNINGQLGGG